MKRFVKKILTGTFRRITGTITHVDTDDAAVALTFDDGPDPSATPALLKILDAHGAKATFFMSGENAAAHPDLVAAVRKAGHAIGNHSWDHPSFPLISRRERKRQISKCARALQGPGALLFRPPYGHQTAASQLGAWLAGHQVITWNLVVPDWQDHTGTRLADIATQQVRAGSVILMHDGLIDFLDDKYIDRSPSLEAVEKMLSALGSRYQFVTVPELLRRGTPVRVNWFMKPDVDFLNRLKRRTGIPRRYEIPGDVNPWLGFNR